jgi:hypothetical protein
MIRDMKHPAAERLEAFAEGVLDESDRVVVESHLLGCPDCETRVDEWRGLFAALTDLPTFEPNVGFADRVMARVQVARAPGWHWSWQTVHTAIQAQAGRAGTAITGLMPKTTFGWAVAATFMALPFVVGGALLAWLMSRSYITPASLWSFVSTQAVEGARSMGAAAVSTALQTEIASWLYGYGVTFLERVGVTGVGMLIAVSCVMTVLSIWILYRNLIRTPTRETHYATYSI